MTDSGKVITTAGILTLGVGTANSFYKEQRPPSVRFLAGVGIGFFIISLLGQGSPELGKGLAIAVATTVILGDGGGVLSYLDHHGETQTQKTPAHPPHPTVDHPTHPAGPGAHGRNRPTGFTVNSAGIIPGIHATAN